MGLAISGYVIRILCNHLHYFGLFRVQPKRLPPKRLLATQTSGHRILSVTIASFAVTATLHARRFFVSGMVQGVGYRFFAQRIAEQLGVAGYVKNLRDGRVEVYAIGPPEQLDSLSSELARGPAGASVTGVAGEPAALDSRYQSGFSIELA